MVCHVKTLDMKNCSRAQHNANPNQKSSATVTVVYSDIFLVLTGPWCSSYENNVRVRLLENLDSLVNNVQAHCADF